MDLETIHQKQAFPYTSHNELQNVIYNIFIEWLPEFMQFKYLSRTCYVLETLQV